MIGAKPRTFWGKGIDAALMMANLQAPLCAQIATVADLDELMACINKLICDGSTANRYATFYAIFISNVGAELLKLGSRVPFSLNHHAYRTT